MAKFNMEKISSNPTNQELEDYFLKMVRTLNFVLNNIDGENAPSLFKKIKHLEKEIENLKSTIEDLEGRIEVLEGGS